MVNIHIHCSYTVTPSETTPTTTLSFSLCDQLKLPNHGYQLYIYTNKNHSSSSLNILITSLSKTLTHYYPFAGRLSWIKDKNHLQLHCNNKGAHFLEATCDVTLKDLGSFDSTHVVQKLFPKINYDVPIEDLHLLAVQFTKFPCGSLTLGFALCRSVLDGSSVGSFINSWAKLAKGERLDSSLIPCLDRTLLDSKILHLPPRFHHHEFSPPPLWENSTNNLLHVSRKPLFATTMLKFTKNQVEKLKNKANKNENNMERGYTSFEVISGYIWRCVCKVSFEGNWNQPTRLTTLVNCRNRLKPPLPKNYFGNATFPTVTPTCSFDDVVNKPLCYVVGRVREAIEKVNDEHVRSVLDYVANQKDMNLLRDKCYNFAKRNGQFGGDPNLYVVGWTNFPFYETDFGWGKPDCLVPGIVNSDSIGKAFVLDDGNGDGFVVTICLQPFHIDALKKLFYEDMEMITSSKL